MKRKVHNSLKEAALQVHLGEAKEVDNQTESVEIPDSVLEYFENYFGDELNEDTSDEDIMEAVESLVDLCDAVCDAIGLDEKIIKPKHRIQRHGKSPTGVDLGATIYHGKDATSTAVKKGVFVPPKYAKSTTPIRTLKPSKEGSLKLTQSGKKPVEEPLVIHGQGSYQKKIMPSDVIKPKSQQ